jgi:TRAP-type C4-dicarboxylate transport system permease small subunit
LFEGVVLSKSLSHFYRFLTFLAALSMIAAFVTVMLGVLGRQFDFNIRGLDAYAGYSIAAALFLALPDTLRQGDHIRVTLLLQKVPERLRNVLEYWSLLAGLGLALYMVWYACRLAWMSYSFNDVSQSADATPLWIPQITMVLGCIGFAVALADALVARIQNRDFFSTEAETAHIE